MKRVLLLAEYATRNGGENSILAVLPHLMRRGWQFQAALPRLGDFPAALQSLAIPLIDLRLFDSDGKRKPLPQIRQELTALIDRTEVDLVHANSLNMGRILGPVNCENHLPKRIAHLRDILKLKKKAVDDLNGLDGLVAVSRATADFHRQQGLFAEKLNVCWNGVDLEAFRPGPGSGQLHARLGIDRSHSIMLGIGQLGLRKNWLELLEATESVFGRHSNWHLVIAGERHSSKDESIAYENTLRQRASQGRLADRVHFLGRVENVADLMRDCDLLVHPALQEPLGRVLLEASASGLPVIATQVGGTGEIFPNGVESGGLLVEANDRDELSQAIDRLICSPEVREKLSENSRNNAQARFSILASADRLARIYREVTEPAKCND